MPKALWRNSAAAVVLAAWTTLAFGQTERDTEGLRIQPALQRFVSDPAFCDYMLSSPDGGSDGPMHRYENAMLAAVHEMRSSDPSLTPTAALFRLRANCDRAATQALEQLPDSASRH